MLTFQNFEKVTHLENSSLCVSHAIRIIVCKSFRLGSCSYKTVIVAVNIQEILIQIIFWFEINYGITFVNGKEGHSSCKHVKAPIFHNLLSSIL